MSVFDEARAIKTVLSARGLTRKELASSLGISVSALSNKLRLLSLDEEVKASVTANCLSERHARLLLRLSDKEKQLKLIEEITDRRLTVAEAEACAELKYINSDGITPKTGNQKLLSAEEAKSLFLNNLRKNAESLRALGVSAKLSESLHGEKIYIYIILGD